VLLALNLAGTAVFALSGGMKGVRVKLDLLGAIVLSLVTGIAGGTVCNLLIGVPPVAFRDWRYLAAAGGAGLSAVLVAPALDRLETAIDVLDAAGLALFCVTGATVAVDHQLGDAQCVILGALSAVGGAVLRDVLVQEIPAVLRSGLRAVPALAGAAIVVIARRVGLEVSAAPIIGAAICFLTRVAGIRYGLRLPLAADLTLRRWLEVRDRRDGRRDTTEVG
jgi:uncharacterized membrane protein YeiH